MTRRSKHRKAPGASPAAHPADGLALLGLSAGDAVRWRARPGAHWQTGTVVRRERDGSVAVTDGRGSTRSLVVARLEVAVTGARGARGWEPLAERSGRAEQLRLL